MELQNQNKTDIFDGTHPEVRDFTKLEGLTRALDNLARYYFRTEATGFDNVPDQSSLVVGTHNGGLLATDMFMFFHAWFRRFGDDKPLYGLGHDAHFQNPLTREMMARGGAVKADRQVALKVLAQEKSYLAVYPTGARDLFQPWYKRGTVDFHGHKGFIKLALEAQVPIVPTVATGAETSVVLNEGEWMAKVLGTNKLLRMPVWPWMLCLPWGLALGPVPTLPLPRQIRMSVGQPIYMPYGPEAAKDPQKVDELYNKVQSTMQGMRDRLDRVRPVKNPVLPDVREVRHRLEAVVDEVRSAFGGSSDRMVVNPGRRAAG